MILFDIDGTLYRGNGIGMRALGEAFFRVTGKLMPDGLAPAGRTDPMIVREGFRLLGIPGDDWMAIEAELWQLYPALLEAENAKPDPIRGLLDGVTALLEELENRRVHLGLLTGNLEVTARIKLDPFAINDFFPIGAYGSDCADRNRLGPIALERARRHFQADLHPHDTWFVGDTERDIMAARACGARVLAVATGGRSAPQLQEFDPDHLLPDLTDTEAVLDLLCS